jgi:hypothetical protein
MGGFEPTLELKAGPAASRVGWSTSGGKPVARDRRTYALVAGFLALGGVLGFAYMRSSLFQTGSPAPSAEVAVQMKSATNGARFFVGDQQIADGVVKGTKGEHKTVRVEADGFEPKEEDVAFDEPHELKVELRPKAREPDVTPVVESAAPSGPCGRRRFLPPRRASLKPRRRALRQASRRG